METENLDAEKSTEVAEPSDVGNNENGVTEQPANFTDTNGNSDDVGNNPADDTKSVDKKQQTKEENAEAARKRRERETQERINAAVKQALEEERKKNVNSELEYVKKYIGKNKFTGEEILDEDDLSVYNTQLEMEKKGLDPLADYAKYTANKNREQRQIRERASKSDEEYYKRDTEMFVSVYGKEEAEKMLKDNNFMSYFDRVSEKNGGKFSIVAARTMYDRDNANKEAAKVAKNTAAQILANEASATGSITSKSAGEQEFYTLKQLKNMSPKDIEANWEKVKASYEKLNN